MKAIAGIICALLIASAHSQQAYKIEDCTFATGTLFADLSRVFQNRGSFADRSKTLQDLNSLVSLCTAALNNPLGKGLGKYNEEKCKKAEEMVKEAEKKLEQAKLSNRKPVGISPVALATKKLREAKIERDIYCTK